MSAITSTELALSLQSQSAIASPRREMFMRNQLAASLLVLVFIAIPGVLTTSHVVRAQEPMQPTFRSSVAVVPITAVVRDSRKRVIRNLQQKDFQVLEQGTPRRIIQFSANDDGPVSVGFLFDTSGSMGLVSNLAKGKEVVAQVLNRMDPVRDEGALYVGSSRVDLQACKLEYSIVSPK